MDSPHWLAAVLDTPESTWQAACDFWSAVTGWRPAHAGDLVVLVPADGDPYLALRRAEATAITLDVHVSDVAEAAAEAARLGAGPGFVSPGGLPFRLVEAFPRHRPAPATWAGGASLVDQIAIDVPHHASAAEATFWSRLTGWPTTSSSAPTITPLRRPEGAPLRVIVQRLGLDDERTAAGAHLDAACTDRAAETARHEALGAQVEAEHGHWTTLRAPDGRRYCLTDRDPYTSVLPTAG